MARDFEFDFDFGFNDDSETDLEARIAATSVPVDEAEETTEQEEILTIQDLGLSELLERKLLNCVKRCQTNGNPSNILLVGCPHQYTLRISKALANMILPSQQPRLVDGRDFIQQGDVAAFLTNLCEGDMVCLNHMESMQHESLRLLEQALLTFAIDVTIGKGKAMRKIRIDLPKFGIVLAIDNSVQISLELAEVFYEIIDFRKYDFEFRLMEVQAFADKFHISFDQEVKAKLAQQFTKNEQLKARLIEIRNQAYESEVCEITENFLNGCMDSLSELSQIDTMDGRMFEVFTGDLLRSNGFENISITQASCDFGVDVIAEKDDIRYAIQCKRYTGPIGVSAVQEVIASKSLHDCHVACVLTNSTFTPAAMELAKKNLVLLWDRTKLQKFIEKANNHTN